MKNLMKWMMLGLLSIAMLGCGSKDPAAALGGPVVTPDASGYAEGTMGDTMATEWFTFKVNNASLTDNYKGAVTAGEGEKLAVVNITLKSTFDQDIPMFDSDFQIQWGEEDDGYGYPVTSDDPAAFADGMLESSYTLGVKETKTGDLVFRVPAGWNDFWLAFQEYFDSEDTQFDGNTFFVSFQAN